MKKDDLICLIDDDDIFAYGIKHMMRKFSVPNTLLVYKNGLEAIQALKEKMASNEQLPRVIILDLNMPVMDGWQFLDEFSTLELDRKIYIYLVTSSIDDKDRMRAEEYQQVNKFIVKPVTPDTFRELISIDPSQLDKE